MTPGSFPENLPGPQRPASGGSELDRTFIPDELPSTRLVAGLLSALNAKAAEPIDDLLEALSAEQVTAAGLLDGWTGPEAWPAGRWRELAAGQVAEDGLAAAKRQAKRAFANPAPAPKSQAALLAYLLTLAAGRVHLGRLPSSMPPEVVEDWLTAVAGVAEPPLGPLFQQAADALAADAAP
jgi:hypothetical protein